MEQRGKDEGARSRERVAEGRAAPNEPGADGGARLENCGSARVAETYRLENPDEECDDGIR